MSFLTVNKTNFENRFVQLNSKLVRCEDEQSFNHVELEVRNLIRDIYFIDDNKIHIETFIKLTCYVRDIHNGKGERDLAYMMVAELYEFYPKLAESVLKSFVEPQEGSPLSPYGSWKDIKYFCNYILKKNDSHTISKILMFCINVICDQIRDDYSTIVYGGTEISLCSRWVPREKSKQFGWLFTLIAESYSPHYLASARTNESFERASKKAKMEFSRIISGLNKKLDTVQIKMCGLKWNEIDHYKTTSSTIMKNKAAFMNNGKIRGFIDDDDRIECADNFEKYMQYNNDNENDNENPKKICRQHINPLLGQN